MAFPTLLNVLMHVVIVVVGVPIIYLLSKALKLRPKPLTMSDPRKEATLVFLVITAAFVVTSVRAYTYKLPPWLHVDAIDVVWVAFYYTILLLPVIMAMKRTGQNRGSIGINGKDRGRMIALGLILSAIYITVSGFFALSLGGGFRGFSSSQAYGLIFCAIVGFSEETIWRGYVQTRLVAYSGTLKGYVATSLLFALWHFPLYYYGAVLEALASVLMILTPSLLFGYIMLRSKNIIPSSIFHLFWDYSIWLLWQIPL